MRMQEAVNIAKYTESRGGSSTPYLLKRKGIEQLFYQMDSVMREIVDMARYFHLQDRRRNVYKKINDPEMRKRELESIGIEEKKLGRFYNHLADAIRRMSFVKYSFRKTSEHDNVREIYSSLIRRELGYKRDLFKDFYRRSIETLTRLGNELYQHLLMAQHLEKSKPAEGGGVEKKAGASIPPIAPLVLVLGLTAFFFINMGFYINETSAAVAFSPVTSVFPVLFTILVVVGLYFIYRK